jgi:hypothetical protein
MEKILITGAGGAPSEGVISSILSSKLNYRVIGIGSDVNDLILSRASEKYLVPEAVAPNYQSELFKVIDKVRPNFLHSQNDREVLEISKLRQRLRSRGVYTFLPSHPTVELCVDKWRTYKAFSDFGIRVPKNIFINDESDLNRAFSELTRKKESLWLRSNEIAGGGRGSLPTNNLDFAKKWIDHHNGWGSFLAAEMLTTETITWLSLWYEGSLIVAQTRKRGGWIHGNRTLSGVTGVTKLGQTTHDPKIDEIALNSIAAVDQKPHGIFGVDMTFDDDGIPNPTEINIARFFTTIQFFTEAGLNMPEIYLELGLQGLTKYEGKKINPLPDDLCWFRGMDVSPRLVDRSKILDEIIKL